MEAATELLLISARDQKHSATLCDYTSSNIIHYYRNGGDIAPKTLNIIGKEYLIGAEEAKPILHVWPQNSQEPNKKISTILPDRPTTVAICPKYTYLAAGIGSHLYVWNYSSGKLFTIEKRNYQPITCIKFSSDGNYVIIGGQDGRLIVYTLMDLISIRQYMTSSDLSQVEPLYVKQDHVISILDIHVGDYGKNSRIASVSLDQTCKIYHLESGDLLLNLIYDQPLTKVIFDSPCWNLYIGTDKGNIYQFNLREPPKSLEHHEVNQNRFEGHQKEITALDINLSNTCLVSGAKDCFVYVWEVKSHQILKKIEFKGQVTNVQFVLNYRNFSDNTQSKEVVLKSLERNLCQDEDEYVESVIRREDLSDSDDNDIENEVIKRDDSFSQYNLKTINTELYEMLLKQCRQ